MEKLLYIFLGGGAGSCLRYLVTQLAIKYCKHSYLGTFGANAAGCFAMGLIMGLISSKIAMPDNIKLLLTVGFLGGLTTFSTFSFETLNFIKEGKIQEGALYMVLSCLVGLFSAFLGFFAVFKTVVIK